MNTLVLNGFGSNKLLLGGFGPKLSPVSVLTIDFGFDSTPFDVFPNTQFPAPDLSGTTIQVSTDLSGTTILFDGDISGTTIMISTDLSGSTIRLF